MRHGWQGLVLAAALAVSAGQPAPAQQKYTILTYNLGLLRVAGWNLVPSVAERSRLAPRELSLFAADSSPDIILLEEVWKNGVASRIAGALAPLGYAATRPKGCGAVHIGSGLLLLVRSPLRVASWRFESFEERPGLELVARKGILRAVIEDTAGGGARFALVGTHTTALDTVDGVPRDEGQVDAYLGQARAALAALDEASAHGSIPAVLLGDFNVGPGYADEAYRVIADAPGVVEAGAGISPESPSVTWDRQNPLVRLGRYPNEPSAKIDHVFLRGGTALGWRVLAARRVFDTPVDGFDLKDKAAGTSVASPLSDHYGFLAEVELAPR